MLSRLIIYSHMLLIPQNVFRNTLIQKAAKWIDPYQSVFKDLFPALILRLYLVLKYVSILWFQERMDSG